MGGQSSRHGSDPNNDLEETVHETDDMFVVHVNTGSLTRDFVVMPRCAPIYDSVIGTRVRPETFTVSSVSRMTAAAPQLLLLWRNNGSTSTLRQVREGTRLTGGSALGLFADAQVKQYKYADVTELGIERDEECAEAVRNKSRTTNIGEEKILP